ncbi:MAG TPA: DedA family protein [Terriglobales bacterium]|nr:DedA family protein [Terriglobales bacterium]
MIANIIAALSAFIISVISTLGYPGIVLLMAIESACIPLPSEVIMPFSGALTIGSIAAQYHREPFTLVLVALFGAIGCNVGSVIAYEIGYYGGRPLVERFGAYILLSKKELDWADHFFARYGNWTVLVSRLLPVVRTFIALPAGIARMPRLRFHVYTFVGSFPWCLMLAYIGMKLGEKWETDPRLKIWFHRFDALILAVIVIGVVWFFWSRWQHRIRVTEKT